MGALVSGGKNVAAAGITERLSSTSIPARWVDIQAKFSNTSNIFLGDNFVNSESGITLTPGAVVTIGNLERSFNLDLSTIWVTSAVSGEGITFNYWSFP